MSTCIAPLDNSTCTAPLTTTNHGLVVSRHAFEPSRLGERKSNHQSSGGFLLPISSSWNAVSFTSSAILQRVPQRSNCFLSSGTGNRISVGYGVPYTTFGIEPDHAASKTYVVLLRDDCRSANHANSKFEKSSIGL